MYLTRRLHSSLCTHNLPYVHLLMNEARNKSMSDITSSLPKAVQHMCNLLGGGQR